MALDLVTIPALSDNYTFLLHDAQSGDTAVIDVPEAGPIDAALNERGWTLTEIWLTHHHADHIQGVEELKTKHPAKVTGAAADASRLPPLDREVADGETFSFGGEEVHVMDVSGHTVGHIAFHLPGSRIAFTADSLMALGCGRVFEGTMAQMWESLQKFLTLDPETTICSGHEYTQKNAEFALTIEPDNTALISRSDAIASARARGEPTVPSLLSDELATNPFLRAGDEPVRQTLGMTDAPAAEVFAEIRRRKDAF
ncbi:hydroxyacylglutathione hydrolase [Roseivivax halodurans JCM 10272]|uniref:Hydroxyacylglutathione hydrolase n=1 Tax=Roseivivax halodurans JCM 10272 TaxID=1449350 RepID=X7EI95_9RHOB|nr:hydroxyacylglutathione hydrolase [Roseivivax halodurans]ETX14858.1 hydroxyacylglutathione hydrolase [Roseivivax halodurans JCM 10272]